MSLLIHLFHITQKLSNLYDLQQQDISKLLLARVWLDIPELNDQVYIIFWYEIVLYMAMYWGGEGGNTGFLIIRRNEYDFKLDGNLL